jgi:DNA invertase Pin-like site-specific DNA recombinase
MARPRKQIDTRHIVALRKIGQSWNEIARKLHVGRGTVVRAYLGAINAPQPSQNPATLVLRRMPRLPLAPRYENGQWTLRA